MNSPSRRLDTFTAEQVRMVWQECKKARRPGSNWSHFECTGMIIPETPKRVDMFYPIPAQRDESHSIFFSSPERYRRCKEYCQELRMAVQDPRFHLVRLDTLLSQLLDCGLVTNEDENVAVERACHLLSRLPATPLCPDDSFPANIPDLDMLKNYQSPLSDPTSTGVTLASFWDVLQVVESLDTNLIRIAVNFSSVDGYYYDHWDKKTESQKQFEKSHLSKCWSTDQLRQYVDIIAELLETVSRITLEENGSGDKSHWFLVKAFLWTSWHRCVMLLFW